MSDHTDNQKKASENTFAEGSRAHTKSSDPLVRYLTRWRIEESVHLIFRHLRKNIDPEWKILVLCAGEGYEGTVLCDIGFRNVLVTDLSENGVRAALARDSRLRGETGNAEALHYPDSSFDLVITQDALHHLSRPVLGLTEMLRVSRGITLFLEPHDSLVGNLIGTRWEVNGEASNYVFRWTKKLGHDIACSYIGHEYFDNLSFSFWHHNIVYEKIARKLGGGKISITFLKCLKFALDRLFWRWGNQFCGMIIKKQEVDQ